MLFNYIHSVIWLVAIGRDEQEACFLPAQLTLR
jgi:hypothetical protein